jgi:SPP1 gp7 family putative phage head morphogenesis protein
MYFISLVGYTDFVNFSASQVCPADTSILSSVLNSQIGWNYADFTYKLTSSSTSIFNALAPIPIPAPASLYKTFQSNTNTLTTAYGKLNNAVGVPSTKPFEFRLNWLNSGVSTVGSQQFISVASLDGGITDSLGVIVTDVGAFDDSYTPQIVNDDTILYKYNGKWYIIRISKNISTRIQRIASTLYKINTISPLNIVDTTTETLNVGSCDYQGRMQFTSAVVPAATNTKCVSVFTGKYSNSIDNGDRLVQIPSLSQNNIDLIGFRIPNTNRIIQNYSIDTFINDTYAFTTYNDASEFVQSDPANPLYLPNSNLPIPIGGIYNNGAVTSKSLTVFLGENYDGYEIGNDLPYAYTPFSLFGQQYLFDGLAIYIANIQNNVLQSTDKICEAYGMTYIAVTPAEAFFLSDFDNSLYSFNGGRTLVKGITDTSRDSLRVQVSDWARGGAPLDELKAALEESGMFGPERADRVATTEATRAFAEGNRAAWVEGGVEGQRWATAADEMVCEVCGGLNGQEIGIDEQFEDDDGETYDGPPAHTNCRCWLEPVVSVISAARDTQEGD